MSNLLAEELKIKMLQSTELLQAVVPGHNQRTGRAPETEKDYLLLGKRLLSLATKAEGGLIEVVSNTRRPTTFQKRLAALRFTLQTRQLEILDSICEPMADDQARRLIQAFDDQMRNVQALTELRLLGLAGPRARRNSKRLALSGLAPDWRTHLCKRGSAGRYGIALLVAALTGCRPAELKRGIKVWCTQDAPSNQNLLHFEITGAKVKDGQGQPLRRLTYSREDPHPLVSMLQAQLPREVGASILVRVESAANFSAEVQRLAKNLWPTHHHNITAYCFRHQWAADAKRSGNPDAVSRGLGHLSRRTQKLYGKASQGKQGHILIPNTIEAERPLKGAPSPVASCNQLNRGNCKELGVTARN